MTRSPRKPFSAAWEVGRLAGIPIRLHFTFLLLLVWFAWEIARSGQAAVFWVGLLLLLFVCVLLHELGHAAVAWLLGVRTTEILLLPIGGLARFERMPLGIGEFLIAVAGPAVNLGLGLLGVIGGLMLGFPEQGETWGDGQALVWALAMLNFALCFFNLLPAFPFDGGRALRSLMSLMVPLEQATRWAARIGQSVALVCGIAGLVLGVPGFLLLALLIFLGASQEAMFQNSRSQLAGRFASDAMVTRFESVAPQTAISDVADSLLATDQQVFPVIDVWGRPAGALLRNQLIASRSSPAGVLEIMVRDLPTVSPDSPLTVVLDALQTGPQPVAFVVEEDRLVGMVTRERLSESLASPAAATE